MAVAFKKITIKFDAKKPIELPRKENKSQINPKIGTASAKKFHAFLIERMKQDTDVIIHEICQGEDKLIYGNGFLIDFPSKRITILLTFRADIPIDSDFAVDLSIFFCDIIMATTYVGYNNGQPYHHREELYNEIRKKYESKQDTNVTYLIR